MPGQQNAGKKIVVVLVWALTMCLATAQAPAATYTWTNTGGGSWSSGGDWSPAGPAAGADNTADFGTLDLSADAAVTLDGPQTIGHLVFGDTVPSNNWALNTGTGGPLTLAVTSGAPGITVTNQTATINAVLAGTNGLTKLGAGKLALAGANTFSGTLAVADGTLSVSTWNNSSTNGPLGNSASAVVLGGPGTTGTLQYTGLASNSPSTLRPISLVAGGTGKIQQVFNSGDRGGNYIHLNGDRITGSGDLVVDTRGGTATSRFIIVGSSPMTGNVTVADNSELQTNYFDPANDGTPFGVKRVTVNAGGVLTFYSFTANTTIQLGSLAGSGLVHGEYTGTHTIKLGVDNSDAAFSGTIRDDGGPLGIVKVGTGNQTLSGNSTFTGPLTVSGGTLTLTGSNSCSGLLTVANGTLSIPAWNNVSTNGPLGNSAAAVVLGSAGTTGTLQYTGGQIGAGAALRPLQLAAGGTGQVQLVLAGAPGSRPYVHIDGSRITGDGGLTVDTTGGTAIARFIVIGNSPYTGPTVVAANSELQCNDNVAGDATPFGAGTNGLGSPVTVNAGGFLTLYSYNVDATIAIGSLSGSSATAVVHGEGGGVHTLKIGGDNTTTAFAGIIRDDGGPLAITKVGGGAQTLSGNNTYTGATVVDGGTLIFSGVNTGTGPTTVNSGLLQLAGPGGGPPDYGTTVKGPLTINSGGTARLFQHAQIKEDSVVTINGGTLDFNGWIDGIGRLAMTGGTYANTPGGFILLNTNTNALTTNAASTSAVLSGRISLRGDNTFTIASGSVPDGRDVVISGQLFYDAGGSWGLTKNGAGTLVLSGANALTGFTTINGGKIIVEGGNNRLGTGDLTILNGSTLDLGANSQNVNNLGTGGGVVGSVLGSGPGTITVAGRITLKSGTVTANLANTGADRLWVGGDAGATVLLGGNNTYTFAGDNFATVIGYSGLTGPAGTVKLGGNNALGGAGNKTDVYSGTLDLNGQGAVVQNQIRLRTANASYLINDNTSSDAGTAAQVVVETDNRIGGAGNLTLSNLAGGARLIKIGAGTLTLNGANTFTGPTSITDGKIALAGGDNRLPTGQIVTITGGGILDLGPNNQTIGDLNSGGAGNGMVGQIVGAGTLTSIGNMYVKSGTLSANLANTGAGRLWIGGDSAATVFLGGNNTYTFAPDNYATVIGHSTTGAAGTVMLGSNTALGGSANRTDVYLGTLDLNGQPAVVASQIRLLVEGVNPPTHALINSDTVNTAGTAAEINLRNDGDIGGTGNLTLSGPVTGGGKLTKIGPGTLILSGNNSFSGTLTVAEGTLSINSWNNSSTNGPLGNSAAPVILGSTGKTGTLQYIGGASNSPSTLRPISLAAGGVGEVELLFNSNNRNSNYVHINGDRITGSGGLTVDTMGGSATARFIVVGSSPYTGPTVVAANSELQTNYGDLTVGTPFGAGTNGLGSPVTVNAGGILTFYSFNSSNTDPRTIALGSLSGSGLVHGEGSGLHVFQIGGDNTSTLFSGTIRDDGGPVAVTKVGGGALTLTGANGYTGATTINAGTLLVNNTTGSGTGAGTVTVNGGLLGGTGAIGGNVVINGGGTISAGNSSPGHLVLNAGYNQVTLGTLLAEIGGYEQGVSYDWIDVAGSAMLSSGAVIDINWYGPFIGHGPFDILTAGGGITNANLDDIILQGDGAAYGQHAWRASIVSLGGTAEAIRLELVPEPATMVMLMLGLPALASRLRRRVRAA